MDKKVIKTRVYDKLKLVNDEKFTISESSSLYCNGGATFSQGINIGHNEATEAGSIRYNTNIDKLQYKDKTNWLNILVTKESMPIPTSSNYPGNPGDISWDSNYIYLCVQSNIWKRSILNLW